MVCYLTYNYLEVRVSVSDTFSYVASTKSRPFLGVRESFIRLSLSCSKCVVVAVSIFVKPDGSIDPAARAEGVKDLHPLPLLFAELLV